MQPPFMGVKTHRVKMVDGEGLKKKGLWTAEEDKKVHGKGRWNKQAAPKLQRSGKSCRLRWMNYLSPGIKQGLFSGDEDELIIRLHKLLGNRWSLIAGRVPGRTDNHVKNHWNTHLKKKVSSSIKNEANTSNYNYSRRNICRTCLSKIVDSLSNQENGGAVLSSSQEINNVSQTLCC